MTVFPLVISWFLTLGYVPQMDEFVDYRGASLDSDRIATVAQIGLSVSTEDELFTIYTDMESFQYIPGSAGEGFSPFPIKQDGSAQGAVLSMGQCTRSVAGAIRR